jgi:hypothetical protein
MAKSTSKLFKEEEPKEMQKDALNLPEEKKVPEEPVEDIQDINLSAIKKKRFRINGDPNKILELNTSDLGISSRLSSAYERLTKNMEEVGEILSGLPDDESELTDEKEEIIQEKLQ